VLINTTQLPKQALAVYEKTHEYPVSDDLEDSPKYSIIRANIAGEEILDKSNSDVLIRSLIRHDSDKIANVLVSIINQPL